MPETTDLLKKTTPESAPTNATPTPLRALDIGCKLTEENWALWLFKITPLLQHMEIASIDRKGLFVFQNTSLARLALSTNIHEDIMKSLLGCTTAQEIWDIIFAENSGIDAHRTTAGINNLVGYQSTTGSMSSNLTHFDGLVRDLITANGSETINIHTIALAVLLKSLPLSFAPIRTIIQNDKPATSPAATLKSAKLKILAEDKQHKLQEELTTGEAFYASIPAEVRAKIVAEAAAKGVPGPKKCKCTFNAKNCYRCYPDKRPQNGTCRDCGEKGHWTKGSLRCKHHPPGAPSGVATLANNTNQHDGVEDGRGFAALAQSGVSTSSKRKSVFLRLGGSSTWLSTKGEKSTRRE